MHLAVVYGDKAVLGVQSLSYRATVGMGFHKWVYPNSWMIYIGISGISCQNG